VIIGYECDGAVRYHLPPQPPRLHSFVHTCQPLEVRRLTSHFWFLRFLMGVEKAPRDELIAAAIRAASVVHPGDRSFLVKAWQERRKAHGHYLENFSATPPKNKRLGPSSEGKKEGANPPRPAKRGAGACYRTQAQGYCVLQ